MFFDESRDKTYIKSILYTEIVETALSLWEKVIVYDAISV